MTRPEYIESRREQRQEVCRLYAEGVGKAEIAEKTGYSINYISVLIAKATRRKQRRMNAQDKRKIRELRAAGKKQSEIAKELGFSQASIHRYLKVATDEEATEITEAVEERPIIIGYSRIPEGTVIQEKMYEKGYGSRIVDWTFVKRYRNHALFKNKAGIRRCFTNAELLSRNVIVPVFRRESRYEQSNH